MKPLKSEFKNYVQFTVNIEDRLLNFHLEDAFLYSIKPKLGNSTDGSKDIAQSIYDLDPADSTKPLLRAFYDNYLKRYWVLIAFKRFYQNHGVMVAPAGVVKSRDPEGTFDQVNGDERAVYLRQLQNDINICETNLFVELNAKKWTYDGFTYSTTSRNPAKKSFGIKAIGGGKKRTGCNPYTEMIYPLPSQENDNDDYGSDYD